MENGIQTGKVGGVELTTTPTNIDDSAKLCFSSQKREMEREAMRTLMGFYARRGGAGLLRACVLRPQCRVSSTEAGQEPQATSSGLLLERRASSSWSGDRSPVTKELSSPGFLRRALPDSLANGETQQVPRFFIDTQAMVRTLEDGGKCLTIYLDPN